MFTNECPSCEAINSLTPVVHSLVINRGVECTVDGLEGYECIQCKEIITIPSQINKNHRKINNTYEVLRSEAFENLRRIAERGLSMIHDQLDAGEYVGEYIDIFQHLLDEIDRAKKIGVR